MSVFHRCSGRIKAWYQGSRVKNILDPVFKFVKNSAQAVAAHASVMSSVLTCYYFGAAYFNGKIDASLVDLTPAMIASAVATGVLIVLAVVKGYLDDHRIGKLAEREEALSALSKSLEYKIDLESQKNMELTKAVGDALVLQFAQNLAGSRINSAEFPSQDYEEARTNQASFDDSDPGTYHASCLRLLYKIFTELLNSFPKGAAATLVGNVAMNVATGAPLFDDAHRLRAFISAPATGLLIMIIAILQRTPPEIRILELEVGIRRDIQQCKYKKEKLLSLEAQGHELNSALASNKQHLEMTAAQEKARILIHEARESAASAKRQSFHSTRADDRSGAVYRTLLFQQPQLTATPKSQGSSSADGYQALAHDSP